MARRSKAKGTVATCVYCGNYRLATREHVFPRGLFPENKPRPATPVIVPVCADCNQKKSGDDSYVRDLINLDPVCFDSHIAQANIRGPIRRSAQKGRSEIWKAFRRRGLWVPRQAENGRELGHHLSVPVHFTRVNRWGEQVARGLYYAQLNDFLPRNYVFESHRILDSHRNSCYDDFITRGAIPVTMGHEGEGIEEVVGWTFLVDERDKYSAIWLVWFYKRYLMLITCLPPEKSGEYDRAPK